MMRSIPTEMASSTFALSATLGDDDGKETRKMETSKWKRHPFEDASAVHEGPLLPQSQSV